MTYTYWGCILTWTVGRISMLLSDHLSNYVNLYSKTITPHYCHFIIWCVCTEWKRSATSIKTAVNSFRCFTVTSTAQQFSRFLFQTVSYQYTDMKKGIYYNWKTSWRIIRHPSRSEWWQCMWVWGLLRHAWLQMASVVFLSNIHIHCSSLSSLMPPTTGYFSEDKHFTPKSIHLKQFTTLTATIPVLTGKHPVKGETATVPFTH